MNHTLTVHKKLEESDEPGGSDALCALVEYVSQLWCILLEIGVWPKAKWVLVGWPMVSRDQECGYVCVLWGGCAGTLACPNTM